MQNMRTEILVLAAAVVLAGWLIGEGLKGPRYVQHGQDVRVMLDTSTGTLYGMGQEWGENWMVRCKAP